MYGVFWNLLETSLSQTVDCRVIAMANLMKSQVQYLLTIPFPHILVMTHMNDINRWFITFAT
jgi:hypothetical protein